MNSPNVVELRANRARRRRAQRLASAPLRMAPAAPDVDRALLNQAVMLNWLGQQPVSFHRSYVDVTGSVVAAL